MPEATSFSWKDLASAQIPLIEQSRQLSIPDHICLWEQHFVGAAPELFQRLCAEYESYPGGWRAIATERVWPGILAHLDAIKIAHLNIVSAYPDIHQRAVERLGFLSNVICIPHIGLGNGAGWAMNLNGKNAIAFGLENVAELGWQTEDGTRKLIAHELGHLTLDTQSRTRWHKSDSSLGRLFSEGFAQYCEHIIFENETWGCSSQRGWLDWCSANESWLARHYLEHLTNTDELSKFYGSWLEIRGWRQTGYFLGERILRRLLARKPLLEIVNMHDEIAKEMMLAHLREMAKKSS